MKRYLPEIKINKNGIKCYAYHKQWIPECCHYCQYIGYDDDWGPGHEWAFCWKGIFFPTKQGRCKRRLPSKFPIRQYDRWGRMRFIDD